jgi:2-succinyl-5-enolpyruvyl-6-hydroxy-3-cyclohexene-1-carboxylate synthase
MRYQPIYDIAELCVRKNIKQVVLCPGSRCAPLTLAFARHPRIEARIFSDERSAGFIALGMAQSTGRPVIVVCTSGTAAYNLAPAIAEAYFSQTPLIALTADRPSEWIAQLDGQTIFQSEIFGRHVKQYFQLPQDYDDADSRWAINRITNDAVNLSEAMPQGPVHINAPFREPLYPSKSDDTGIAYSEEIRVIKEDVTVAGLTTEAIKQIRKSWLDYSNVLVVGGQQERNDETTNALTQFQSRQFVPVVNDIISNLHEAATTAQHSDLFLGQAPDAIKQKLQPDLLITFGQSVISKNLKIFLRKYPAREHWHIQPAGPVADTFKNLTHVFHNAPSSFFTFLSTLDTGDARRTLLQKEYNEHWREQEERTTRAMDQFFDQEQTGELGVVRKLLDQLPANANLHLANSMSVRYANFIGLSAKKRGIRVFSNRGTSGIDGCVSTAVGHALTSSTLNVLITGDLAFFYDRNAFWHNYPAENLRILLLNNHGGLIFDVLEGPSSQPEAREYFITRQTLNAGKLCEEFGFTHIRIDDDTTDNPFPHFLSGNGGKTMVLEYESDTTRNKEAFDKLKTKIKKSYES